MKPEEHRRILGQFFTADWVSAALVSNIETNSPRAFVDIGAGKGSLLKAVRARWNGITGVSVDVDKENIKYLSMNFPTVQHLHLDLSDYRFPQKIKRFIEISNADLIVSNPPYIKFKIDRGIYNSFYEAGTEDLLNGKELVSSEALFMSQIIRAFKNGVDVALIVPDYIITSSKAHKIRKLLLERLGIYKIIETPRGIFKNTDTKTHLIFLRLNRKSPKNIEVGNIDASLRYSKLIISNEEFLTRGDYNYYQFCPLRPTDSSKAKVGDIFNVTRGNLTIPKAKKDKIIPFHTTDFSKDYLTETYSSSDLYRKTKNNSILMGRVGRNIADQVIFLEKGGFNFSDCVISIESSQETVGILWKFFQSLKTEAGKQIIRSIARGSGATSINISDVNGFKIEGGIFNE